MGTHTRARRRPPGRSALSFTPALLAVIWVILAPHTRLASAGPNGLGDPPAPPPLPWPAENPITDSEEVGYLPGRGTVTAAGDYQYRLPIEVPDGRAGMEPQIALVYSSRTTASGIAGVGWSLEYGGSEITRCAKTFHIDGKADSPNHWPDDALCLDGQRIVQIDAGPPMGEGAEYRVFRDNMTRIVVHSGAGEAAAGFEVFGKDGTIRTYTALTAKRLPASLDVWPNGEPAGGPAPIDVTPVWVLTRERDRAGNAVLYSHDVDPDSEPPFTFEHRVTSIEYTATVDDQGATLEAPRRKVVFEYSTPAERPDQQFQYQNGIRRGVSRRLTRIKLYAPNPQIEDVIGQYTLGYEAGQERSFLTSVQRLDESGWRRMWERSFEWAHDDRPHFQVIDPPALAGAFHETTPILFDADNDGRDEILVNGRFCRTTAGSPVPFDTCLSGAVTAGIWGRPTDVNGDGKADILKQTGAGPTFATWDTATSTFLPLAHGVASNSNLGDANGDGLIDAYALGPRVNPLVDYYDHEWYLRLNTGTGFADPVAPLFPAPFTAGRKAVVSDLDGNGRAELHVGFHPADEPPSECAEQPSPPWEYHAVGLLDNGTLVSNVALPQGSGCRKTLLDLNGDNLQDIFTSSEGGLTVRYNTGTRFLPAESAGWNVQIYPRLGRHTFEIADVDTDGQSDLISSNEASSLNGQDHLPSTYLYLRRSNGFKAVDLGAAPYEIPAYDPEDFPPNLENRSPVVKSGDLNGDALPDLVVVLRDREKNTSKVRVLLQQWEPRDLLVRVRDEHSPEPRESVFYSPFTTDSPSPSTCSYPSRCLRGGTVVAREHWIHRQDAPGAVRRTAYDFDDLRTDVRGRGVLGFGRVRAVDLDSFAETITLFDHATLDGGLYPFAGLAREVWRITPILRTSPDPDGGVVLPLPGTAITARVSRTVHEHERRFTNGGVTHAVFSTGSRTEEWEEHVTLGDAGLALANDGSATPPRVRHTTRTLDDFGNELFSAVWTESGQRCETTTVPLNDPASWLLGLPQSTAITCNEDGQPLPEARLQTFQHDSLGRLKQVTVEPNHPELTTVTTYERDGHGLVEKVSVAANGEPTRKTFIAYDDEGVYPRATWNDLGHAHRQLVHPALGVPLVAEVPNGVQVRYRYDGFGRVREIDPDDGAGRLISYQQDTDLPWALRVVETHEDGGASQVLSDEWGRSLGTAYVGFDGEWVYERTGENRFRQRTEDYRPAIGAAPSIKTVTTYDTLGRAVEIEEPNGAITTIAHTMFESITTDAEGRQNKLVRDADDRVSQSTDLYNGQWVGMTYLYGAFGQLEHAVDPVGNTVHTVTDKLGRRVLLDDPDRGITSWTYNAFGEVETEIDALGDTTILHRDILGRVTSAAHSVHGITTLGYDGAQNPGQLGRITSAQSPDGVSTTYDYDPLGRLVRTTWATGDRTYEVLRTYDPFSRLETVRYPVAPGRDPFVTRYGYNNRGYTNRVYDWTEPAAPKVLWEIGSLNEDGLLEQTTTGNGFEETRQYDPATGRLTHIEAVKNGAALHAIHYGRDLTGDIRTRQDFAPAAPRTETFDYDDLDRLSRWTVTAKHEQRETKYDHDLLGNIETITRNGVAETHEHDGVMVGGALQKPHALTRRTVAGASTDYAHDARGRQNGGGREITWTPFDLPAQIAQAGHVTTFRYDAFGKRIRKERTASGVPVERVDTIAGLYERRWKPNAPVQHVFTVEGTDGPVAQVVYAEGAPGAEQTYYLHREALGSTGLVTDKQGDEVERTYFDPFGEKVDAAGEAISPLLGPVKLGFTGQSHDDELGLINFKGRIYDPTQKRFLTPDLYVPEPLSGQSYNRYAYVMGNPLRYTDPTGFQPAPGDLGTKGAGTQPDGGAAAPAPVLEWPVALDAEETVVLGKVDDTGNTPPPPPPPPPVPAAAKKKTFSDIVPHLARGLWGAAKELVSSAPPVAMAKQIGRTFEVAGTAASQAVAGEWSSALGTLLEVPEGQAEAAARILTGPIDAVMSLPAAWRMAMDGEADPEDRGAAVVQGAQAIATVAAAVAGAGGGVKKWASGAKHGNSLISTKPAKGYSLRDRTTGEVLKYGDTINGTKRYTQTYLDKHHARIQFEAKGTKREMHQWQHEKILEYKANNGGTRPPLNKSDY